MTCLIDRVLCEAGMKLHSFRYVVHVFDFYQKCPQHATSSLPRSELSLSCKSVSYFTNKVRKVLHLSVCIHVFSSPSSVTHGSSYGTVFSVFIISYAFYAAAVKKRRRTNGISNFWVQL